MIFDHMLDHQARSFAFAMTFAIVCFLVASPLTAQVVERIVWSDEDATCFLLVGPGEWEEFIETATNEAVWGYLTDHLLEPRRVSLLSGEIYLGVVHRDREAMVFAVSHIDDLIEAADLEQHGSLRPLIEHVNDVRSAPPTRENFEERSFVGRLPSFLFHDGQLVVTRMMPGNEFYLLYFDVDAESDDLSLTRVRLLDSPGEAGRLDIIGRSGEKVALRALSFEMFFSREFTHHILVLSMADDQDSLSKVYTSSLFPHWHERHLHLIKEEGLLRLNLQGTEQQLPDSAKLVKALTSQVSRRDLTRLHFVDGRPVFVDFEEFHEGQKVVLHLMRNREVRRLEIPLASTGIPEEQPFTPNVTPLADNAIAIWKRFSDISWGVAIPLDNEAPSSDGDGLRQLAEEEIEGLARDRVRTSIYQVK